MQSEKDKEKAARRTYKPLWPVCLRRRASIGVGRPQLTPAGHIHTAHLYTAIQSVAILHTAENHDLHVRLIATAQLQKQILLEAAVASVRETLQPIEHRY